ncbi:MAG: hypothetical protein Fur007_16680 [Rhodoferax sp.]
MTMLPRRAALRALAGLPALGVIPVAPEVVHTPWPEVKAQLPGAVLCGAAPLRVLGLAVYDAQLWVAPGFGLQHLGRVALALTLIYRRALTGAAIAQRSIQEMHRLAPLPDALAQRWHDELLRRLPDVAEGDRLTGLWQPGQGAAFWANGQARGAVNDAEFAQRFFDIWLAPETREPALRRALLAGARA